jgi:hypothetical protein
MMLAVTAFSLIIPDIEAANDALGNTAAALNYYGHCLG